MDLSTVCVEHDHEPGLPDRERRSHLLAMALRQVEAGLLEHGYADAGRSLETLHCAIEDVIETPSTS